MLYRLKTAFYRFMIGRYGSDDLNKFIFWVYFALIFISLFIKNSIIYALVWLLFFIYMYRSFSKNIYKRQAENRKYLVLRNKVASFFRLQKNKFKERKTHVYKKCVHCKATIRLPRRKGKHVVCCPICRKDFNVNVF